MFKVLIFVFDQKVQSIESHDRVLAASKAIQMLPGYAAQGPVTMFEFNPDDRKWSLTPHSWQDWSHSLVMP